MPADVRAEIVKQSHRPAHRLLLALAVVQTITFTYLIPYAGFTGTVSGTPAGDRGLAAMLPEQLVGNAIAGLPAFVGAFALIFGVLVAGSEYGWETWKTLLVQRPSRLALYGAKLVTVAAGLLVMVLTLFAVAAVSSVVVATVEDQPMRWPGIGSVLLGIGGGWLVAMMWGALGVLLAIAFRGVAMPIGLGLVWLLAIQNLLAAIAAPLLDWVADLQKVLPGPNAGSLAAALGAFEGAPGVDKVVSAGQAVTVVVAYLLVFGTVGGWLLRRRDIV